MTSTDHDPSGDIGDEPILVADDLDDMPARKSGWLGFALRWGIAIVGVAWVVSGLTIRDRVFVLVDDEAGLPMVIDVALAEEFDEGDASAVYEDPETGLPITVSADRLLNGPDKQTEQLERGEVELAGMTLEELDGGRTVATRLWYYTPERGDGGHVASYEPGQRVYEPKPPQPIVRAGLGGMVRDARPWLLVAAVLVFPITLIATGLRWWRLMTPLGIEMTLGQAYRLNMVGLFYNTFMLGSTGGDFVKAFYAGRHAAPGRKAAAWMSVFVDRLMGLLVLVAMGGTAALIQYTLEPNQYTPVAVACLQVAWAAVAILLASASAGFVLTSAPARRVIRSRTGLGKLIDKAAPHDFDEEPTDLKARVRVKARGGLDSLYEVAEAYRNSPRRIVEAALLTVPVHAAVIVSALLAGHALGLPIPWPYYFVCVPVIVLSASMPISPQGAGVMEFFAVLLTRPQGATVAQAFALALCIRVVQILWNLTGGIFVLKGGYSGTDGGKGTMPGEDEPAAVARVA